jgi:hypothetical protein
MTIESQNPYVPARRDLHQLLLTWIYNKIMLVHLNPTNSLIQFYELDPNFSYKNQQNIIVPTFNQQAQLL